MDLGVRMLHDSLSRMVRLGDGGARTAADDFCHTFAASYAVYDQAKRLIRSRGILDKVHELSKCALEESSCWSSRLVYAACGIFVSAWGYDDCQPRRIVDAFSRARDSFSELRQEVRNLNRFVSRCTRGKICRMFTYTLCVLWVWWQTRGVRGWGGMISRFVPSVVHFVSSLIPDALLPCLRSSLLVVQPSSRACAVHFFPAEEGTSRRCSDCVAGGSVAGGSVAGEFCFLRVFFFIGHVKISVAMSVYFGIKKAVLMDAGCCVVWAKDQASCPRAVCNIGCAGICVLCLWCAHFVSFGALRSFKFK